MRLGSKRIQSQSRIERKRTQEEPMSYGRCPMCGEIFERTPQTENRMYCSAKCRQAASRERREARFGQQKKGKAPKGRQLSFQELSGDSGSW
jgi:hypothetical protein